LPERVPGKNKIPIECNIHRTFEQSLNKHLIGQGCPHCRYITIGSKKATKLEDYINRSNKAHNYKYKDGYEHIKSLEYIKDDDIIRIICPEHGPFNQNAGNHKYGNGCQICGGSLKKTREQFIEEANKIHNNKYDYTKTSYSGNNKKVIITCKEHGDFLQRASAHLSGQGCMKCRLDNRKTGLNIFLKRCKDVHGDRYDYSLINEYKNSREKVKVICKRHGIFEISPYHHTCRKQGCNECTKLGLNKFIELSNIKHNYKYDYSLIKEYKDNKSKVKIICKYHGEFTQRVNDHILKCIGCPECTLDRFRISEDRSEEHTSELQSPLNT
jgi:hypothetical protein